MIQTPVQNASVARTSEGKIEKLSPMLNSAKALWLPDLISKVIFGAARTSRAAKLTAASSPDCCRTTSTSARHSSRNRACSVTGNNNTATRNKTTVKLDMNFKPPQNWIYFEITTSLNRR